MGAAKGGKPAVTEASGHHSEGASQAGVFVNDSAVALNRKPTASRKSDGIIRASVNKVNKRGSLDNILRRLSPTGGK